MVIWDFKEGEFYKADFWDGERRVATIRILDRIFVNSDGFLKYYNYETKMEGLIPASDVKNATRLSIEQKVNSPVVRKVIFPTERRGENFSRNYNMLKKYVFDDISIIALTKEYALSRTRIRDLLNRMVRFCCNDYAKFHDSLSGQRELNGFGYLVDLVHQNGVTKFIKEEKYHLKLLIETHERLDVLYKASLEQKVSETREGER